MNHAAELFDELEDEQSLNSQEKQQDVNGNDDDDEDDDNDEFKVKDFEDNDPWRRRRIRRIRRSRRFVPRRRFRFIRRPVRIWGK